MKNKSNGPEKKTASYQNLDLSSLMRNLPGMVYRCRNDEDWTMEYVSGGCFSLTGFQSEQLIDNAYISYGGLIHPEDRYMVWEEVNRGIDSGKPFKIVYRIIADGGTEKWVFEQGQGIFNDKNELQAVEGFITDVTEQKTAELELGKLLEEKKLLLNEIHHRIKNNMQQIVSLLNIQGESCPECREVLDSVVERINIFTEMHQELYSYDNRDLVDLYEHVGNNFRNLLMSYNVSSDGVTLELDMPDRFFEFDTAIPLGLMFNELLSNSLKHAFKKQRGRIWISVSTADGGGIERVEYSDSGTDLGNPEGGFGMLLLEALAAQLGLETEIRSKGNTKYIFRR